MKPRKIFTDEEKKEWLKKVATDAQNKRAREIPDSVACPICKGINLDTRKPITLVGWIFIIIGLFFIPFWGLGIISIIIGLSLTEKKFFCIDCKREF